MKKWLESPEGILSILKHSQDTIEQYCEYLNQVECNPSYFIFKSSGPYLGMNADISDLRNLSIDQFKERYPTRTDWEEYLEYIQEEEMEKHHNPLLPDKCWDGSHYD